MNKQDYPYYIGQRIDNNSYIILDIQETKNYYDLFVENIETKEQSVLMAMKPKIKKQILQQIETFKKNI